MKLFLRRSSFFSKEKKAAQEGRKKALSAGKRGGRGGWGQVSKGRIHRKEWDGNTAERNKKGGRHQALLTRGREIGYGRGAMRGFLWERV